jgi:hydrogenase maturation factor
MMVGGLGYNLGVGKIPLKLLHNLLQKYAHDDPRVIIGARVGEDAAVIDMGNRYLVVKSDPITFVTEDLGYYAVNVNANDIATYGAVPRWFLATMLLPEQNLSLESLEGIFSQIATACQSLNIALIGGHTEITYGLDRPIISGHMLGEVDKESLVTTAGAKPGDIIILTKGICIEGTSIIARIKMDDLLRRGYSPAEIKKARNFLFYPGISVVKDALVACQAGRINSMHDPTEGGLAMALHELAHAAQVGIIVEKDKIPLLPESVNLCQEYSLDPLGTISSGALLLTLPPQETEAVLTSLAQENIPAAIIGRITEDNGKVLLQDKEGIFPLPVYDKDEITKIF